MEQINAQRELINQRIAALERRVHELDHRVERGEEWRQKVWWMIHAAPLGKAVVTIIAILAASASVVSLALEFIK